MRFAADRGVQCRTVLSQWMTSPSFTVALENHVVIGLQKQHVGLDAALLQIGDEFRQRFQVIASIACIDAYGQKFFCLNVTGSYFLNNRVEQCGWQVVHAVETRIFENMQRNRLP